MTEQDTDVCIDCGGDMRRLFYEDGKRLPDDMLLYFCDACGMSSRGYVGCHYRMVSSEEWLGAQDENLSTQSPAVVIADGVK